MADVSAMIPETVVKVNLVRPRGAVEAGIGQQHYGWVFAGSSGGDMILKVTGWNFSTPTPQIVICHPRQTDNLDHGWADQFGTQTIETGRDFVRIRIRRLDSNGSGWGQNLRVDMLIIE